MGFERFTAGGRGYRPRVSIRANGQIGFNQGAIHRWKLSDYKWVVLFYDRDEQKVGIMPTEDEAEEGKLTLSIRPNNAFVAAKAFLDYYSIDYRRTRSYAAEWADEEAMMIVDLAVSEE